MTDGVRRKMKRRSAVERGIDHLKAEHRMRCNHLAHATGDAINAVLAAAGYNVRRLLNCLALSPALIACTARASAKPHAA